MNKLILTYKYLKYNYKMDIKTVNFIVKAIKKLNCSKWRLKCSKISIAFHLLGEKCFDLSKHQIDSAMN